MHDIGDENRKTVLGEALFDELRAIRELVSEVPAISRDVKLLKEDVEILKDDVATIKSVIKHQSVTINRHDREIKVLQAKVA